MPERESLALPPRISEPVQRTPAAGDSFDAAERRAARAPRRGRTGKAAVIFDGIRDEESITQLDPGRSTPEALAAFQTSKRLLLPAMARQVHQEARVAYAGDFSMTLTKVSGLSCCCATPISIRPNQA